MVDNKKRTWSVRKTQGVMPDFSAFIPKQGNSVGENSAQTELPATAASLEAPAEIVGNKQTKDNAAVHEETQTSTQEPVAQVESTPEVVSSEGIDHRNGEVEPALEPAPLVTEEPTRPKKKQSPLMSLGTLFARIKKKPSKVDAVAAQGPLVTVSQMEAMYARAERQPTTVEVPAVAESVEAAKMRITSHDNLQGMPVESVEHVGPETIQTQEQAVKGPTNRLREPLVLQDVSTSSEITDVAPATADKGESISAPVPVPVPEVIVAQPGQEIGEAPQTVEVAEPISVEKGGKSRIPLVMLSKLKFKVGKKAKGHVPGPGTQLGAAADAGTQEPSEANAQGTPSEAVSETEDTDASSSQRFTAMPIRALYGYLPDVRESDALEYALGYAAEFLQQQGMVFYDAFPYKRGYAFEVQQGGDGKAFLPEIIEYFNTQGEFEPGEDVRVVIKTATRKAEVFRTREGLDFVILPEGSGKPATSWLTGSSKLTPAINRKTGYFVVCAAFFASGFIAMLFSSMLTRYQGTEPMPTPKEEFVSLAETPSGQWNNLTNIPQNSYVKSLRFQNGKWQPLEVTVDLELVKQRTAAIIADQSAVDAPVSAPAETVNQSSAPVQATNGVAQ